MPKTTFLCYNVFSDNVCNAHHQLEKASPDTKRRAAAHSKGTAGVVSKDEVRY